MKERPIIFSGPMVRALMEGKKTMTRRVVKPQPPCECAYIIDGRQSHALCYHEPSAPGGKFTENTVWVRPTMRSTDHRLPCPYGQVGDSLWVREAFAPSKKSPKIQVAYKADGKCVGCGGDGAGGYMKIFHGWLFPQVKDKGPSLGDSLYQPFKSPIHMPRWASRLTLEITEIRVERLQGISEADAIAEGFHGENRDNNGNCWHTSAKQFFSDAWEEINGKKHPWESNPFLWVIGFAVSGRVLGSE